MTKILPVGKGAWLHKYQTPVDTVVAEVLRAGLGHFFIKVADGTFTYGAEYQRQALVNKLKAAGVQVWGWQYTYGTSPTSEANRAIHEVLSLGLDGFVINAEKEYKNRPVPAQTYAAAVRAGLPGTAIGLSTYRYPELHPEFPFKVFREFTDFDSPQVYWLLAHNPVTQLNESKKQYDKLVPILPFVPSGSAWKQKDWAATPAEVTTFIETCKRAELSGCTMWEYNNAQAAGLWDAIAAVPWEVKPPPPVPVDYELRIKALEVLTAQHDVQFPLIAGALINFTDRFAAVEERIIILENDETAPKTNLTVTSRAVARITKKDNEAGKPIMVIKEPRVIFTIGTKLLVDPQVIDADSSTDYYKVLSQPGELYIRVQDGTLE